MPLAWGGGIFGGGGGGAGSSGTGAAGRVALWSGTGTLTSDAGLTYDASTGKVGASSLISPGSTPLVLGPTNNSQFSIYSIDGTGNINGVILGGAPYGYGIGFTGGGTNTGLVPITAIAFRTSSNYGSSSFSTMELNYIGIAGNVSLFTDAAEVLAQRNGVNAQTSRIYGTYTDASNYERLSLSTTAGSGVTIAAETAGSGADNLSVTITPAGTGKTNLTTVNLSGLGTYADNAAATGAGLVAGDLYRTSTGVLMVTY